MIGFNEKQEGKDLLVVLNKSRTWLRQINHAHDIRKSNPDEAARLVMLTACQVLRCCCEERYPIDFLGCNESTYRHVLRMIAAQKKTYDIKADPYFEGVQKAQPPQLPNLLDDALPAKTEEYKNRYRYLMQVLPMFDVFDFTSSVI